MATVPVGENKKKAEESCGSSRQTDILDWYSRS